MNIIIPPNGMTTLDIARETGKRHYNVIRDTRVVLGQQYPGYNFDKTDFNGYGIPGVVWVGNEVGQTAYIELDHHHAFAVLAKYQNAPRLEAHQELFSEDKTVVSMTTKEIAEFVGKRHDHVLRDTRTQLQRRFPEANLMAAEVTQASPKMGAANYSVENHGFAVVFNERGQTEHISLCKDFAVALVANYDFDFGVRLSQHISKLEAQLRIAQQPAPVAAPVYPAVPATTRHASPTQHARDRMVGMLTALEYLDNNGSVCSQQHLEAIGLALELDGIVNVVPAWQTAVLGNKLRHLTATPADVANAGGSELADALAATIDDSASKH